MFLKIFICLPIVIKLSAVFLLLLFFYSFIGLELLTTINTEVNFSPYDTVDC
jgi:hypothetical protein